MSNNFGKIATVEYSRHSSSRDYGLLCVKSDLKKEFPVHQHDFYEFEIVIDGAAKNSVDGVEETLCRGDFYCLCPTTIHKVTRESDDLLIYNVSVFLPDATTDLQRIVDGLSFPCKGKLDEETLPRIKALYDVLFDDVKRRTPNEKEKVSALALYILSELSENVSGGYESTLGKSTNTHVQNAMKYTQMNFTSELKLSDVAKSVGVSECYLSSVFSSIVGSTFKEYLTLTRISHAKKLLTTTELSVTDIAFSCGFGSFSNFERVFKRNCGVTPKEYRSTKK